MPALTIDTKIVPPEWAVMERKLLDDVTAAVRTAHHAPVPAQAAAPGTQVQRGRRTQPSSAAVPPHPAPSSPSAYPPPASGMTR